MVQPAFRLPASRNAWDTVLNKRQADLLVQAAAVSQGLQKCDSQAALQRTQTLEHQVNELTQASLIATQESEAAWATAIKFSALHKKHSAAADAALRKARRLDQLGKLMGEAQCLVDSTAQLEHARWQALHEQQQEALLAQQHQQVSFLCGIHCIPEATFALFTCMLIVTIETEFATGRLPSHCMSL